jgi:hypothetical protein
MYTVPMLIATTSLCRRFLQRAQTSLDELVQNVSYSGGDLKLTLLRDLNWPVARG